MKYGYAVKVNGVWYQPNTEIPEPEKSAPTVAVDGEKILEAVKKPEPKKKAAAKK